MRCAVSDISLASSSGPGTKLSAAHSPSVSLPIRPKQFNHRRGRSIAPTCLALYPAWLDFEERQPYLIPKFLPGTDLSKAAPVESFNRSHGMQNAWIVALRARTPYTRTAPDNTSTESKAHRGCLDLQLDPVPEQ
jgi:hypothetical protein